MHDIALMAANEWAKAQAGNHHDPAEFGQRVAQVYLAASATQSTAGDQALTAAASASRSVRPETQQVPEQIPALFPNSTKAPSQAVPAGAEG